MKFVDYKYLESLLIEGEELSIANEGLGSNIKGIAMKFRNKKPSESKNNKKDDEQIESVDNKFHASVIEDFNKSINDTLNYIVTAYNMYITEYYTKLPAFMHNKHNERINEIEERINHSDDLVKNCNEKAENVISLLKTCNNEIYYSVSQKCSEYCINTSKRIDEIIAKYNNAMNKLTELQDLKTLTYTSRGISFDIENTNEFKNMYADIQKSCAQLQVSTIKTQKLVSNVTSALNSAIIVYD